MGVIDPYSAYCLDEAVSFFGSACEKAMDDARRSGGKNTKQTPAQEAAKAENALRRMLGVPQKFRSLRELNDA